MKPIDVELQYITGCGNATPAEELVESVLSELAPGVSLRKVVVRDEAHGRELGFHGSPTIRVNGVDVDEGAGPGAGFS